MTGPSIDPATLSTISAKIDYALTQLSIINEKLDSHVERLARLEKFQQAKKVGSLLRRATLAGGYIIDSAPFAAPPSSTTLPAAIAVPPQFHTAAQFTAPAADIGGGALSIGVTASTLLVAAPTVVSALAAGAATAPLAAKAEIASAASVSAASSSCSSAAVQRHVPPHRRAKAKVEASATASALAVPSSSSSVHLFSAADG